MHRDLDLLLISGNICEVLEVDCAQKIEVLFQEQASAVLRSPGLLLGCLERLNYLFLRGRLKFYVQGCEYGLKVLQGLKRSFSLLGV